jgi:hypothetical protein
MGCRTVGTFPPNRMLVSVGIGAEYTSDIQEVNNSFRRSHSRGYLQCAGVWNTIDGGGMNRRFSRV